MGWRTRVRVRVGVEGLVVEIGDDEEGRKSIRDGEITDVEIEGYTFNGEREGRGVAVTVELHGRQPPRGTL